MPGEAIARTDDSAGVGSTLSGDVPAIDTRALQSFNRDVTDPGRSLRGAVAHHPIEASKVERYREHAEACRAVLVDSPDLHAAAGRVLAEGLLRGAAGLVEGLEELRELLEQRWDELVPPLREGRAAKAWNVRLGAIEVLCDRELVGHYLLRLPLFGVERDSLICWRAFLIASGREGELNLAVDPDGKDDDGNPVSPSDPERPAVTKEALRAALNRLGPASRVELRETIRRGVALCGESGVGALFAERARSSSAALGAEARGGTLSLDLLGGWFSRMQDFVDAIVPPEPLASGAGGPAATVGGHEEASTAEPAAPTVAPAAAAPLALADTDAARRALADAFDWLCRHEPASPASPFLLRAEELSGLSFVEIVTALDDGDGGSVLEVGRRLVGSIDRLVLGRDASELGARLAARRELALERLDGAGAPGREEPDRVATLSALAAAAATYRHTEPASPVAPLVERGVALASLSFEQIIGTLADIGTDARDDANTA